MNKERIVSLGEVFTPNFIVKDMLKGLSDINYSTTFFEPGCGDGNFVNEILKMKLKQLTSLKEVKKSLKTGFVEEFEHKLIILIGSIYAVEIDKSNRDKTINRLFKTTAEFYIKKVEIDSNFLEIVKAMLEKNIILGDLINEIETIKIYEFSELPGFKVKIKVFKFEDLLYPDNEVFTNDLKLFGHIPKAVQEFNNTNYRNIINIIK